jgi:multiple sugar transport system substrate-binding protein
MFKKLTKIIIMLTLVSMLISACAQPVTPPNQELLDAQARLAEMEAQLAKAERLAEQSAALPIPLDEFTNANIDWKRLANEAGEEGLTINIAVVKHSFTDSLLPLIPVFEELTGIRVLYGMLSQAEYWPKLGVDLSTKAGLIDVFMTGPEMVWAYVPPDWIEPLDSFIENPKLTDKSWYDVEDFYEAAWNANRWDGVTLGHDGYGYGPTYAIPVTYEIMSLMYRKDLLEDAGVKIDEGWPHTWEDILEAAKAATKDTNGDGRIDQFGIISRGHRAWPSMFGGYSNIFYSYGGLDFDSNMRPAVNSEQGIKATELWVELMQCCAPKDMTDLQWFQVKQAFASGTAAMVIDCDWWPAATFERSEISDIAGTLGYAVTPPGPDGQRVQDLWFWSLGINSASYHKEAAWLFIQWATSKPVLLRATTDYDNWNPPRQSVWEHPTVVDMSKGWGNYRAVVEENRNYTKVPHAVNPLVVSALDAWWGNIQDAILDQRSVKDALDRANREMFNVMQMGGYYDQ